MRARRGEAGSSLVETVVLITLLLVPLIWMLGALSQVHRAALATTSAAREAAVAAARSSDPLTATRAARTAAEAAFLDQGLTVDEMVLESFVEETFERGSEVGVRIRFPVRIVALPFVQRDPSLWVNATHVTEVDLYRSRG